MDQTLYLETYGLSLRKDGGALNVLQKGKRVRGLPAINVGSVVIFAEGVSVSGGAVRLCNDNGIPIFFMPRNGGTPSVLAPVESRWPERQAAQIRAMDDPVLAHSVRRGIAESKIRNQASLMTYFRNSRKLAGGVTGTHPFRGGGFSAWRAGPPRLTGMRCPTWFKKIWRSPAVGTRGPKTRSTEC